MKRAEHVRAETRVFTIVYEVAEEGGYTVRCPSLPPIVTEGDTIDEARQMALDAIKGYLAYLKDQGRPLPAGDAPAGDRITENLAVETA